MCVGVLGFIPTDSDFVYRRLLHRPCASSTLTRIHRELLCSSPLRTCVCVVISPSSPSPSPIRHYALLSSHFPLPVSIVPSALYIGGFQISQLKAPSDAVVCDIVFFHVPHPRACVCVYMPSHTHSDFNGSYFTYMCNCVCMCLIG